MNSLPPSPLTTPRFGRWASAAQMEKLIIPLAKQHYPGFKPAQNGTFIQPFSTMPVFGPLINLFRELADLIRGTISVHSQFDRSLKVPIDFLILKTNVPNPSALVKRMADFAGKKFTMEGKAVGEHQVLFKLHIPAQYPKAASAPIADAAPR